MPPAWTPEKHNRNEYGTFTGDINQGIEYITPPRSTPTPCEITARTQREEHHMKWLRKKIPKLGELFQLHRQIGEGTFSAVFLGSLLNDLQQEKLFAIKHLVPTTHPKRIEVELRCIKLIGGQDNVIGLDLCLRENENIVFIMPYLPHEHFTNYVYDMDAKEIALYLRNLLTALKRVHSFGIIHRDVKPNNFLYDRKNKKYSLVDFGLAQVSSLNVNNSQKRKLDQLNGIDESKPKKVLYNRNINTLENTVTYLQNTVNKSDMSFVAKENVIGFEKKFVNKSPFKSPMKIVSPFKSPLKITSPFKSPLKMVSDQIKKSPYKFPGLDLPSTHSTFAAKMPGQRRLFTDAQESSVFQKPIMLVSSQQRKRKQTQRDLNQNCKCFNKASICNVCLVRKAQDAPRAGTPGFRPPEVLLKYPKQTTAVDIWAVGVIMLCMLSGTYPFFRAPDDITALAEIITLFGDEQLKKVSKLFGRQLICSEKKPPLDLRKVCCKLRMRNKRTSSKCNMFEKKCELCGYFLRDCLCIGTSLNDLEDYFPGSAYDLLKKLLDVDPFTRITAEEALNHPFLK